MAKEFIPMEMADGSILYIQTVDVHTGDEVLASAPKKLKAMDCIDKAMPAVTDFCAAMKEKIQKLEPDEIELEFSVSFTGDLNAVIASAEVESGVTIHLVWKKNEKG